jgi:hypothetical protein
MDGARPKMAGIAFFNIVPGKLRTGPLPRAFDDASALKDGIRKSGGLVDGVYAETRQRCLDQSNDG